MSSRYVSLLSPIGSVRSGPGAALVLAAAFGLLGMLLPFSTFAGDADPLSTGLSLDELPESGSGTYVWAKGKSRAVGRGAIKKYSVGIEEGLEIDPDAVAALIEETLADPRSWTSDKARSWGFQRVERGGIKFVIATPDTVDRQCLPLDTEGEVSCAKNGYISINLKRWEMAVPHWDGGMDAYRRYVINHEMGHYLAKPHEPCPGPGQLAPVMQQQTYFLKGCRGNAWPFPHAGPKPKPEGLTEAEKTPSP